MPELRIAEDLSLPLDLVTSTQAIIAQKRSGKSYTASVEAEEMLMHQQQIAVIDPTSAWFGLRSSADGVKPGFAVAVFGGDHADAPLDPRSGRAMAKALVDRGFCAIFDIGNFETDEQILFVLNFTSELLRINKSAVHLFIDEADTFAPQMLEGKEQKKCLGAMSRLVKQGGIKGIGVTMITQRSSDLNKKLLSQIERLTLLRMRHPPDIKPVAEWVSVNVGPVFADEVSKGLPRLEIGEAFVCDGPGASGIKVRIRPRITFNSGATPKPGEKRAEPKVLAAIDIQKLGQEIAAAVEEEKQNDPAELKNKIRDLERKLQSQVAVVDEGRVQMLMEQIQQLEEEAEALRGFRARVEQHAEEIARDLRTAVAKLESFMRVANAQTEMPVSRPFYAAPTTAALPGPGSMAVEIAKRVPLNGDAKLDGPSTRVISALAELQALRIAPAPREQVAVFAGYTHLNSKGLTNAFGSLRSAGYIDYPGPGTIVLTAEGRKIAPPIMRPKTEADFHARLIQLMDGPSQRILQVLIPNRRNSITRDALAVASGYGHLNSKGFTNAMGRLRSLGLLEYPASGRVQATALLFFDGRAA